MKKAYEKPMVLVSQEMAEGVYMGSGAGCLETDIGVMSTSNQDREFRVYFKHTSDDHGNEGRTTTITFNKPVCIVNIDSVTSYSGDGTSVVTVVRSGSDQYQNGNANWGCDFFIKVKAVDGSEPSTISATAVATDASYRVDIR